LIITLGAPWGAFRSSDYCLSDPATGKPIQIEAGTKQLSAQGLKWIAEVAFTGGWPRLNSGVTFPLRFCFCKGQVAARLTRGIT
jgi:hypothetical protein